MPLLNIMIILNTNNTNVISFNRELNWSSFYIDYGKLAITGLEKKKRYKQDLNCQILFVFTQ